MRRWKKSANFIVALILSIVFIYVTLLNVIGPLHINASGEINHAGKLAILSSLFIFFALAIMWELFFYLEEKPKTLFFVLIIYGIITIIIENYIWAFWG